MRTIDVGLRLGDAIDPFHLANGFEAEEEAGVSEEAVRRRGGGGGPRELGMSQGWRGRGARVKCGRVSGR